MSKQDKKTLKAANKLEDEILDAVGFVPPDDGEDADTTVEVNLADVRRLVMLAWEGQRNFKSCALEIQRREKLINSLMRRLKEHE